jgi:hypothetical protein
MRSADHPVKRPIFGSAKLIFNKHRIDLMIEQFSETNNIDLMYCHTSGYLKIMATLWKDSFLE